MAEVVKFAKSIKLDTNKLLADWIVCIPGFTLEKYRQLQESQLSIFSIDCFGGLITHNFALPFLSPFVNLFMHQSEFIRFLRSPRVYMEEELVLKKTAFEKSLKFDFPIFTMGNVEVCMNHYPNFEEAVQLWNQRKKRINWYNLFVVMHTESPEIAEQFNRLPYAKKVCFVPFKSNLTSAWYINPKIKNDADFRLITHWYARGDNPCYYDPFDMLLYGKKTQLIDM